MYVCCTRTEVAMQHELHFISKTCIPVTQASNFSGYATGHMAINTFAVLYCDHVDDFAIRLDGVSILIL